MSDNSQNIEGKTNLPKIETNTQEILSPLTNK
jgi:hypothetical protein